MPGQKKSRKAASKAVFSTLANQVRLDIIISLSHGEKNVSQLMAELGLGQTLISHNLKKLATAGFIRVRKSGNFRYYALNRDFARPFLLAMDPKIRNYANGNGNGNGHLRSVVSQAPVTLAVIDKRGVYTFVSGGTRGRYGLNEKQMLGKSIFDIFKARRNVITNTRRALRGESVNWTTELNGRIFDVVTVPFRNERGQLAGAMSVTYDVTSRVNSEKKLKEAEAQWRKLAEGSNDFLAHVDRDGTFLAVNHSIEGMLRDKVIGTSLFDYVPAEFRALVKRKIASVFMTGKAVLFITRGVGPQPYALYECRVRPLKSGKKTIAVTIAARKLKEGKKGKNAS